MKDFKETSKYRTSRLNLPRTLNLSWEAYHAWNELLIWFLFWESSRSGWCRNKLPKFCFVSLEILLNVWEAIMTWPFPLSCCLGNGNSLIFGSTLLEQYLSWFMFFVDNPLENNSFSRECFKRIVGRGRGMGSAWFRLWVDLLQCGNLV